MRHIVINFSFVPTTASTGNKVCNFLLNGGKGKKLNEGKRTFTCPKQSKQFLKRKTNKHCLKRLKESRAE